jgi:hypothetical protein
LMPSKESRVVRASVCALSNFLLLTQEIRIIENRNGIIIRRYFMAIIYTKLIFFK